MPASARSLLVPGVALAAAGAVALSPALIAPPAVTLAHPAVPAPVVQIDQIQLAGIGRDIYDGVSAWIGYGVELAQYGVGFVPVIGPPIADQIGINYFDLIQPLIRNTVYVLSDIVANPLNLPGWINSYLINQAYVGIGYLNAQAGFFGFPPLPPIPIPPPPPLASTPAGGGQASASAVSLQARTARAVAAEPQAPVEEAPQPVVETAVEAQPVADSAPDLRPSRAPLNRAARATAAAQRTETPAAAASESTSAEQPAAPAAPARPSAAASRGGAAGVGAARTAARGVAGSVD